MKAPFVIGRTLLGGFFLYNGINHFRQLDGIAQYASHKKVPKARVGVAVTGAMLTAGGVSMILGIKPKLGAAAIVGFLAVVSPLIHDFWNVKNPEQRQQEMINFTKNLALLGATIALAGVEEPWPASLSRKRPTAIDKIRSFGKRKLVA